MIHTGKEPAAGKSAVRKIMVKYLFFKAIAKLENAFKKRPVFTISQKADFTIINGKIRDFFFLRKHPIVSLGCFSKKKIANFTTIFLVFYNYTLN